MTEEDDKRVSKTGPAPTVIIVGGGFAGLSAAKALRNARVRVILIDRNNHHIFQPLLYQVAISVLSPGQVASPIREILRGQKNATVLMGEVTGVDKEKRLVFLKDADRPLISLSYDYLVLATGAAQSYFGRNEFEKYAPGLKSLADALQVRNKVLQAFEQAEAEEDPRAHRDLLTFVLVGAGPAGVEMAGAVSTLVRQSLRVEFRRVDPLSARVVLLDRSKKVLASYPDDIANGAKQRLEKMGVEVRLGQGVDTVDGEGVIVAGERIRSKTVIWTAGVAPSPAGKWLNAETDHAGRVRVQPDLSVPGFPEVFVTGDTATFIQDGSPLAGVAQVAIQQGRYAGLAIRRQVHGESALLPFRYADRGTMAVVGPGYAVMQSGRIQMKGFAAWVIWAVIHILFLSQPGLSISVFVQWMWTFLTHQPGSRLIVSYLAPEGETTRPRGEMEAEQPIAQSSGR